MVRRAPTKDNICAVIVTFNPDDDFSKRLEAIASQVAYCVIIDNSAMLHFPACVINAAKEHQNVEIIKNEKNNLARADNKGALIVKERGYQWMLTMDQDSLPEKTMVAEQIRAYHLAREKGLIVDVIGVNFLYDDTGEIAFAKKCARKEYVADLKETGIQRSGRLLSLTAYERAKRFCEWFWIDYVDTEYSRRLERCGFLGIIACNAHMRHHISKGYSWKRLLFSRVWGRFVLLIMYPRWTVKKLF